MSTCIDIHVHLAVLPDGKNGCLLSPRLRRSPVFRFLAWRLGADLDDPARASEAYVSRLARALSSSEYVRRAVILGIDGVYDLQGKLDAARTDFLVSNDCVLQEASRRPEMFLAGVSINPRRADALDEVARCAEAGAVLVKVLPNSQLFDPARKSFVPFYRALARYRLPLLSHIGYEFTLPGREQSFGEPLRLRRALDEGVRVIAAHGGGIGIPFSRRYFDDMLALFQRYPNFFADTSAVTLPNRCQTMTFFQRHPQIHSRLFFGTDYPLPVLLWTSIGAAGWRAYGKTRRNPLFQNPFDRHYLLLRNRGVEFRAFRHPFSM